MTGFFHFYQIRETAYGGYSVCQCPMTGFFHFYNDNKKNENSH